jgi:hypothetical protein
MAKRRKKARKTAKRKAAAKRLTGAMEAQGLMQVAERTVRSQSNKVLGAATKRYNRFMRQAARATNDANKRKYLAAALSAVVIAGVVAGDLKRRMDKRTAQPRGRKKRL